MRPFHFSIIIAHAVLLPAPLSAIHAAEPKPNVVLILIDDFGYECVTADGGESYKTPVMDKLAATGVLLRAMPRAAALHADARAVDDGHEQSPQLHALRASRSVAEDVRQSAQAGRLRDVHRGKMAIEQRLRGPRAFRLRRILPLATHAPAGPLQEPRT